MANREQTPKRQSLADHDGMGVRALAGRDIGTLVQRRMSDFVTYAWAGVVGQYTPSRNLESATKSLPGGEGFIRRENGEGEVAFSYVAHVYGHGHPKRTTQSRATAGPFSDTEKEAMEVHAHMAERERTRPIAPPQRGFSR